MDFYPDILYVHLEMISYYVLLTFSDVLLMRTPAVITIINNQIMTLPMIISILLVINVEPKSQVGYSEVY